MDDRPEQGSHLATLDALRGIAALAVVAYHLTRNLGLEVFPARAYLAVDFFFVLSGFVIARTYESRLQAGLSLGAFARVRLIRLYPLIALGMCIGFLAKIVAYVNFPESESHAWGALVQSLVLGLLLIPVAGADMFRFDAPAWSLLFEMGVNLVFAAIARFLTLGALSVVVVAGALAVGVSAYAHHDLNGGVSLATFGIGVARVWFSFFVGVLIFRLVPARGSSVRLPAGVAAVMLILSLMAPAQWSGVYDVIVVLCVYPIMVALSTSDPIAPRWRSWALRAGALSYPVYILHVPALAHFAHFRAQPKPALIVLAVLAVIGAVLVAAAATRLYDRPIRKWLTQYGTRPRAAPLMVARDRD